MSNLNRALKASLKLIFLVLIVYFCCINLFKNEHEKNTDFIDEFVENNAVIKTYSVVNISPLLMIKFELDEDIGENEAEQLFYTFTNELRDDDKFQQAVQRHKHETSGTLIQLSILFDITKNEQSIKYYKYWCEATDYFEESFKGFIDWYYEIDGKTVKIFTIDYDE